MRHLLILLPIIFASGFVKADYIQGLPVITLKLPQVEGNIAVQPTGPGEYRIAEVASSLGTNVAISLYGDVFAPGPTFINMMCESIEVRDSLSHFPVKMFIQTFPVSGEAIVNALSPQGGVHLQNPPEFRSAYDVTIQLLEGASSLKPHFQLRQGTAEDMKVVFNNAVSDYRNVFPEVDLKGLNPLACDLLHGKAKIRFGLMMRIKRAVLESEETLNVTQLEKISLQISQLDSEVMAPPDRAALAGLAIFQAAHDFAFSEKLDKLEEPLWGKLLDGLFDVSTYVPRKLGPSDIEAVALGIRKVDPLSDVMRVRVEEGAYAK